MESFGIENKVFYFCTQEIYTMQIKQKMVGKTMDGVVMTVNVPATLDRMERGESVFFTNVVNENTLRNTCVRLRHSTGKAWTVDKCKEGFTVTRTV